MNGMQSGQEIDLALMIPEITIALTAVLALLAGSWLPRRRQSVVRLIALAGIVVAMVASIAASLGPTAVTAAGGYTVDASLTVARVAVLLGTAVVVALTPDSVGGHRREAEFTVLVLLGALGTIVVAGATDLLVLGAGYLLASIPLYALVGFCKDRLAVEGALKYYLMGALFGLLLLVGIVVLLAAGGSTVYSELARGLRRAPLGLVAVGSIALTAGLMFKAGAVPGHFWVPDAVEAASPAAAAFIATVPKVGALVAIFRISAEVMGTVPLDWALVIALVAAVTMTLGNFAAFFQTSTRRLLAYSTISQVGYLLVPVAAAAHSSLALPGLLYYLLAYVVTNLGAFAVAAALPERRNLTDYLGLLNQHRWLALGLIVCLLGLIGTPPAAVFVGKLAVFAAGFDAKLGWLVVLMAANSVASVFYYLRWIAPMFQRRAEVAPADAAAAALARRRSGGIAVVLAMVSLVLGILAGPVLNLL